MDWKEIKTQNDIDELLHIYGDFHDACITSLRYKSGSTVTNDKTMHLGTATDQELQVTFQRQWDPITMELYFVGIRRLHLVGWQEDYINAILSAYLSFHEKLLPGKPDRLIVWSDTDWFDPAKLTNYNTFKEPDATYIIANQLKWRIVE